MNKNSHFYVCLSAVVLLAAIIFAGCRQEEEVKKDPDPEESGLTVPAIEPDPDFYPAATPFAIVNKISYSLTDSDVAAGTEVTNVIITWEYRTDAKRFSVYRDGSFFAYTTGNKIEDYGLSPGLTYTYVVAAWSGKNPVAVSRPVSFTPFVTASDPNWRHNFITDQRTNIRTGSTGGTSGVKCEADGLYYDFQVTAGGTRTFQYRTSSNGSNFGNWINLPTEPGGSAVLTVTAWTGNVNGAPTTINPAAYVPGGTVWNGGSGQTGVNLEGVHWYTLHDQEKYVLGCHREPSGNYNLAHFMLVSCYTNDGRPYGEITYSGRPFGFESRDQRVFRDDDGTGYALCSALGDSHFFKLDPEWKEPVEHTNHVFIGSYRETPDILRVGGWYFYAGSRQNGWYPSQTQFATAAEIGGEWTALRPLGNAAGYDAQFNRFETYGWGDGRRAIALRSYKWAGSRDGWARGTTVQRIAPVSVNGTFAAAEYFPHLVFHDTHGLFGVRTGYMLSQNKPVSAPANSSGNRPDQANLFAVTDGLDTEGGTMYRNTFAPYSLIIDLEQPGIINEITLATRAVVGSDGMYQFTLEGSPDNETYTALETQTNGTAKDTNNQQGWIGFVPLDIANTVAFRYVKITVYGIKDIRHSNGEIVSWADGIIQLAVYGMPAE